MLSFALLTLAANPAAKVLAPEPHVVKAAVLAADTQSAIQPSAAPAEASPKMDDKLADAIAERVVAKLSVKKLATTQMPSFCGILGSPLCAHVDTFTPTQTCCTQVPPTFGYSGPVCGVSNDGISSGTKECQCDRNYCGKYWPPAPPVDPWFPIDPTPAPKSNPCFAKESTTACMYSSSKAECENVLMVDLAPGDLVLGRDGATRVVSVQHKAVDTIAEMLTFHTADGASVSMTPDHALFVDGALVAAAEAEVGATLTNAKGEATTIKRIVKGSSAIINAVTADGTVVANGVLAASNPLWIASLTVDAPLTRTVVNAAIFAAGDVDSVGAGVGSVLTQLAASLAIGVLALNLKARKASA